MLSLNTKRYFSENNAILLQFIIILFITLLFLYCTLNTTYLLLLDCLRLVPCLDCVKQGTADPHLFSSASVKRATDLKAPFLQCTTNFHIVSINALHSLMPPSNLNDFHTQLNSVIRELDDAEISETSEVSLLCHSADFAKSDRFAVGPKRLQTDLTSKLKSMGMSVQLITEKDMSRISSMINSA